jgi:hypothetical protein
MATVTLIYAQTIGEQNEQWIKRTAEEWGVGNSRNNRKREQ